MRGKEHCKVYQARTPNEILIFREVAEQINTDVLFPYNQARFSVPIFSPGVPSLAPQGGGLWPAKALHKDLLPFLHQVFSVLWMPICFNNPTARWGCLSPSPFTGTRFMLLRSFWGYCIAITSLLLCMADMLWLSASCLERSPFSWTMTQAMSNRNWWSEVGVSRSRTCVLVVGIRCVYCL